MPWFNADDRLHSHPKARRAGLAAMGLWVLAGTLSTSSKADGAVPQWYVDSWGDEGRAAAQSLIDAAVRPGGQGLWLPDDDGYQFRAWAEYQRTKEQVERDQELARKRKERWKERHQND